MGKIKGFEAFAGVGAQRMALRNLVIDFEVVGICEIDKFALKSYEAIHGECNNFGDISKINPNELPDMDLFTYSFPCQDLSIAGKREGLKEGTRSGLLYECEKIIEVKKPKYLLLENVKYLVGKKFKPDFDKWLNYLEDLGYKNYWKVLNAKDYGVPQNRERVFVVSILGEHKPYEFPKPIELEKTLIDVLCDDVDSKYYLSAERIGMIYNWKANQRPLKKVLGLGSISPTLTARGAGSYHSGMILINEHFEDTVNVDEIILEQPITDDITFKLRNVTPYEAFRLMDIKDTDITKIQNTGISEAQLYKLAGNSIVVAVLEGIFKNLLIDNEQVKEITTEEEKRKDRNIQLKWCI